MSPKCQRALRGAKATEPDNSILETGKGARSGSSEAKLELDEAALEPRAAAVLQRLQGAFFPSAASAL